MNFLLYATVLRGFIEGIIPGIACEAENAHSMNTWFRVCFEEVLYLYFFLLLFPLYLHVDVVLFSSNFFRIYIYLVTSGLTSNEMNLITTGHTVCLPK